MAESSVVGKPEPRAVPKVRPLMEKHRTYNKPSAVKASGGKVEVRGPDHVEVDLTPEAAEETSGRLVGEAVKARGQRRLKHLPHQPK